MIRRGVCAIIFFDGSKGTEYLLLKRKQNWKGWEFLKGGRKKNESEMGCLRREMKEEIGISVFGAQKTDEFHIFKYKKEYAKDHEVWNGAKNRAYLVQIFTKKIRIDQDEHSGFKWVDRKTALKMITWKDSKKVFERLVVN